MNKSRILRIIILLAITMAIATGVYRYWIGTMDNQGNLVLYGNVDLREVELAFVLQERIIRLYVEEGDQVKKGQLLAEIDPARFQQTVSQRQADVAVAEANKHDAQVTYQRLQGLVKKKLASPQDVDDAKARLDASRAQVSGANAALARAQKDSTDTKLMAPSDGVIQARILEPGDIAGPQKPVFTLALIDPVWVRTYVSELELGKIRQGMRASVSTDTFPDKTYTGQVGYISPSAEFTPKTVQTTDVRSSLVYQVRILLPNPQNELHLGMPVTVTITTGSESLEDPIYRNNDAAE